MKLTSEQKVENLLQRLRERAIEKYQEQKAVLRVRGISLFEGYRAKKSTVKGTVTFDNGTKRQVLCNMDWEGTWGNQGMYLGYIIDGTRYSFYESAKQELLKGA